ncbi:copper p-type atpase [Ceraceosorus bombacis]|uniref:P-type Cu(+) transporter n=1 Tax=Ceraceosorus bombacis TaxID=401625 RepID=A0A0P1BSG6_9BASI|nr:copper p-type atpase [Ceraceosorus bombacis]
MSSDLSPSEQQAGSSKLSSTFGVRQDEVTATFKVGGMTCGACVETIERMLRQQAGIYSVSVALLAERAVVAYDASKWTPAKIAEEIEDIGFEASALIEIAEDTVQLHIYGMTCASCTSTIEKALRSRVGVIDASVSLALETAQIEIDTRQVGPRDLVELVEDCGFDATLSAATSDDTQLQSLARVKEIAEWRHAFFFSLSFAIPVFFINMLLPRWSFSRSILVWQPLPNLYLQDLLSLALTAPVQFGIGKRFYLVSWKALRHGSATMDVLIVLGTTASFAYSTFSMLFGLLCGSGAECLRPSTFFETSTMLITFVSLGRYLENAAKGKTSEALSKLIGLTPSTAVIWEDKEAMTRERRIGSELIQKGDYVKVVPGEKIAADGLVVRGESTVDESMVTGEAMPVSKTVRSNVIGGTVNGLGSLDIIVTRAGKDASLAQIVRLVSEAQVSKAPIQAYADRVAGLFVPMVIGLGGMTFISWMVIAHLLGTHQLPDVFQQEGATKFMVCLKLCISVVVVACPCALGLSTPTAVMVGTGVGAQNGILIKGGGPLEASYTISQVLFDKTGTLTEGKLSVSALCWPNGTIESAVAKEHLKLLPVPRELDVPVVGTLSRQGVLAAVAAAERRSEHPLARAVAEYCADQVSAHARSTESLPPQAEATSFESVTGAGVKCRVVLAGMNGNPVSTHIVKIGKLDFVGAEGSTALEAHLDAFRHAEESSGRTVIFAAIDGSLALVLSLADKLKPSARPCIAALARMNVRVGMLTGDTETTALALAKQLGLSADAVHAGLSPNGKRSIIARLRSQAEASKAHTGGIAMVGDGINDSPALAAASVGIALSTGSEIAMEAADVVLMRSDLRDVPAALHLARRIFSQIRLNFLWATLYNIVSIPLAMGIFLPWGWHLHPMVAGAAMACSSVSVVLSSLTLRFWKRPHFIGTAADDEDDLTSPVDKRWPSSPGSPWPRISTSIPPGAWEFATSPVQYVFARVNQLRTRRTDGAGYEPVAVEMA